MEKSFDCWCELAKREKISAFFADRVSKGSRSDRNVNHHAAGKIITYFDDANFFGDCVKSKNFSLGKVVMLYAFLIYLLNAEKISDENFRRFISLFKCDYDKISCALLATGDYWQVESNGQRHQFGSARSQSWQNLFHQSALVKNFDETKEILDKLLSSTKNFSDEYLQKIIDDYLAECESKSEFDWTYYFIKYKDFRPPRYGRYWWENFSDEPYCFVTLYEQQKRSANSYQPFLKAAGVGKISRDDLGMRLYVGDRYVMCENSAYVVKNFATDAEEDRLTINQSGGIDTEDRIEKFKAWIKNFLE